MGRFSQLLGGSSFSTTPKATLQPGTRFRSLNRDSVAAFDKELLASIMGVKPAASTPITLPSSALKLNISSPVAGQNWRMKPQAITPTTVQPPPTMRQVGEANEEIPVPVIKTPVAPAKALSLKTASPVAGQSWRMNPMGLAEGEVRTLTDVGYAAHDALDLFEAQGRRGVNDLIYWMNDLLIKTNAPGTGSGQAEKNKQAAAFMEALAGDQAKDIIKKSQSKGTWYETVVTAVNGGLSLLQSVAMGFAIQGGNIAGAIAGSIKRGSLIATAQLAKQYGYRQTAVAVANKVREVAATVGLTPAASVLPAVLQSAVEGGPIYKELTDMGKTPTQASIAALMSIAGTALSEGISLDHLYQGWVRNVGSSLAARLTTALGSATFETVQELGQNLWQNFSRASVDDTQQLFAIEETIDTIIGIFPAAFLLGGASFSAAGFRQAYQQEARIIEAKIAATFNVDDVTARKMADQAIEQFGPVVRDVFLHGIDTKEVTLAQALEFAQTSDPYVQWLVQKVEQPSPAGKQTTAATTAFVPTPTTDRSLNRYLGQQASPTQRQQTVGRGRWSALYEQELAAKRQPLKPLVGVRPEMQPVGALVEPPVGRPTGPVTTPTAEPRTPVARATPKTPPISAISTPQTNVPTLEAPSSPVRAAGEVRRETPTLFNQPVQPTEEELKIERAKHPAVEVRKTETEVAIEQAAEEAKATEEAAEGADLVLWDKTIDQLATAESQRAQDEHFAATREGQQVTTLRKEIAELQSGEFDQTTAETVRQKKREARALEDGWNEVHGWLAQVDEAVADGRYEQAVEAGTMTQEQVNEIMRVRQQMKDSQRAQELAEDQLAATEQLRLTIAQQRENVQGRPFELTDERTEGETGKGTEAWVGRRNPTARELINYIFKHYPIVPSERSEFGAMGTNPLITRLFRNTKNAVTMDELVDLLKREVGLSFPTRNNEGGFDTEEGVLQHAIEMGATSGAKNAKVDYLGQPFERTPEQRRGELEQEAEEEGVEPAEPGFNEPQTPYEPGLFTGTPPQIAYNKPVTEMTEDEFVNKVWEGYPTAPEGYTLLYHATPEWNVDSILKHGLLVGTEETDGRKGVVWTATEPTAYTRGSALIVFKVPNNDPTVTYANQKERMVRKTIAPEDIVQVYHALYGEKGGVSVNTRQDVLWSETEPGSVGRTMNYRITSPTFKVAESPAETPPQIAPVAEVAPAFTEAQRKEAELGSLRREVERTRQVTTQQATEQAEQTDPESLWNELNSLTQSTEEDLFAGKVEERNPERTRPLVPSEDLFSPERKAEDAHRSKMIQARGIEALKTAVASATSIGFPTGARNVAVGISPQFIYKGSMKLTGAVIKSYQDVAALSQIFRSPLYETMRYVFAKDGVVVANEGRTSHMAASGAIYTANKAADIQALKDTIARTGANELWLVHNHPSGNPGPSTNDFKATHAIDADIVQATGIALKGHIIVDSQAYSVIHTQANEQGGNIAMDPLGRYVGKVVPGYGSNPISMEYTADIYPFVTDDSFLKPLMDHPVLGKPLSHAADLAEYAKLVQTPTGFVTLIFSDGRGNVRLVQEVPRNWFVEGSVAEVQAYLRTQAENYGANRAFAVYGDKTDQDFLRQASLYITQGYLVDGVSYDSDKWGVIGSWRSSVIELGAMGPMNTWFGKNEFAGFTGTVVVEETPTGYTFDDPRNATTDTSIRYVDALFTTFDELLAAAPKRGAAEYKSAVEGTWEEVVRRELIKARIPADVFTPIEVINAYRLSKGPKSANYKLTWIKERLEKWVREQLKTEIAGAQTKKLEPGAALDIEEAARAAGIEQKRGGMLAPQMTKKAEAAMKPYWDAVESKGGAVERSTEIGNDDSTRRWLLIAKEYNGSVQRTLAYRKLTRAVMNEAIAARAHQLAVQLGGGQALPSAFELPPINSKTNRLTERQRMGGRLRGVGQGVEGLEYTFRRLDEDKHGLFWRTFYQPINNAKDYELRQEDGIQTALNKKIEELGLDVKDILSVEQTIASDVRPDGIKMTVDDMMAVYLHAKNPDNLRHLLAATGNRYTQQEVLNMINALTPAQIELADWMQATRQLDGVMAAQVTWDTKMKNMLREMNYWPIERETRDVAVQNINEELLERIESKKNLMGTQPEAGFLKERTHAATNPIKLEALQSFIEGEARVQHYIALMPVIDQLTRIVGNSEFAMAYIDKEGKTGWQMLYKWLQDVSNPDLATGARNQSERFMRWMRGNAASALLGFRLAQFFKAGLSWWVGAAEIGDMNAIRGTLSFLTNRNAVYDLIREYAPQVYHRSMEREIAEAKIAQHIDARLANKITLREASMIFTIAGDRLAVMSLWKGKFDSYLRAHPEASNQEAADAASEVIRLTQAAWDTKDLSEIQRSGEMLKLLTMFTNEVTRHYNYLKDSVLMYRKKKLGLGTLLRRLFEIIIVQGLVMGAINRKAPPKNLGEAASDVVQQMLEVRLPIVGRYITNGMDGFVDSSPAGMKILQEIARGGQNVMKIGDKGIGPVIVNAATIYGYFTGLPVEAVRDIYKLLTPEEQKSTAGGLPPGF